MRLLAATAAALLAAATPTLADETTGEILAFDRVAGVLVLTDKTVWEFGPDTVGPVELNRGDRVKIVYETAGEDGLTAIDEIILVESET